MSKHINLKDGKLVITFKYDPAIVSAMRAIDGRLWNKSAKHWEAPKEQVGSVLEVLKPLGFTPHLDVVELARQEDKIVELSREIRASGDGYTGALPLFDFQKIGASFLKQMPCSLLADVPGLGKSIQTIAATEGETQVLIFCPASLKYSWKAEIEKWQEGAKVLVVNGDKRERTQAWVYAGTGTYKYIIANYELLLHDYEEIEKHEWDVIVCDEATRISNPQAQTVKNLKKLKSKKRIALTGTPISNSPDDIFSIIDWLSPRYLGTFYQFREKYCVTEERFDRVIGYKNLDELSEKLNRFMLRRTKEEVFKDFPPKTIETIKFDLTPTEWNMYRAIQAQVIEELKKLGELDTRTLGIVPVKMLRLKQCTDHTKLVGGYGGGESSKLETLRTLLKPIIDSGEKAIIFTQFAEMLFILAEELKAFRPTTIYGGVDTAERMVKVTEFNDDPEGRIIIMTEAGAYGLNMQSASYVFHYDSPWSIAKLQQREDRAHRIGRDKPVTVYNLVAKDTIDEYVLKVLARKNKVSVNVLKDAERLEDSGLTPEDIKEILRM